jgi:hypothetical protein
VVGGVRVSRCGGTTLAQRLPISECKFPVVPPAPEDALLVRHQVAAAEARRSPATQSQRAGCYRPPLIVRPSRPVRRVTVAADAVAFSRGAGGGRGWHFLAFHYPEKARLAPSWTAGVARDWKDERDDFDGGTWVYNRRRSGAQAGTPE